MFVLHVSTYNRFFSPHFQPPPQKPEQSAATKPTSAVDILAQKALHPSVHRPLKVVVQPFLISADLLYPGEEHSIVVCMCVCTCVRVCITTAFSGSSMLLCILMSMYRAAQDASDLSQCPVPTEHTGPPQTTAEGAPC